MHKRQGSQAMQFFVPLQLLAATSSLATGIASPAIAAGTVATASPAASADGAHDIRFRADSLVVEPVLNVRLIGSSRTAVAGSVASFDAYSNYPAFIAKSEIRLFESGKSPDSVPLAILPVDADAKTNWHVPLDAPKAMFFILRVYDAKGVFDETRAHELTIVDHALPPEKPDSERAFGGPDETERRNIPIVGLMATVTGRADPLAERVRVSGQSVPVTADGRFAAQQIVPREKGRMDVVIDRGGRESFRLGRDLSRPASDWFVVGHGDLTIGKSSGSGANDASGDPAADGDYVLGRAAFYAKGVLGRDWKVTAALDTGETEFKHIFSNLDRKDPAQLLRRLNREQYYPTYGDDSTLVEDAPTQGRFYLRVARRDSQLVVGNFVTSINGAELVQLDRGLFGALLDYKSDSSTGFGERKVQLTAFASDPGTVPGREEFRGTGGSLYFLKRQDVSIGSERVRAEVRDRDTGIVLESRELHPQEDYDFDPFQGRLTLLRPLPSTTGATGAVREGSAAGNVPVLVVRYEYTPPVGSLDGYTVGGRGTVWLGERVRLGLTAQRDTVEASDQTLLGGDVLVRLAAGTYAKAEVARSDGAGFGEGYSVDGGLSFADIAARARRGSAYAWRAELAADFAELMGKTGDRGKFSAYYENQDAGFSSAGRLGLAGSTRWGAKAFVPVGATGGSLAASYEVLDAEVGKSSTGTVDLVQKFGAFKAKVGIRYEDRAAGLLFNSVQRGGRTDAGVELEYLPGLSGVSIFGFAQGTVTRDDGRNRNDRAGIGAKAELTKRLSLDAEVSEGTGGFGSRIRLNHRLGEGSEAYVGYALNADRTDIGQEPQNLLSQSDRGMLTVGTRRRFSDALSVYGESRVGFGGRAPAQNRTFGLTFDPTKHLSVSATFENGQIDDAVSGLFRRTAGSLSIGYTQEGIRLGTAIEARREHGQGRDQTVWLLRNDASYQVDPDWRAVAKFNIATASSSGTSSINAAEYTEAMLGLAFRPVGNERFNALLRATYFADLGPVGQITGSGRTQSPKQVSTVISADTSFDLSARLTLGLKYGFRQGKVSLGRDSDRFVKSNAHLAVVRADYTVLKTWDVMVEGRALWVTAANDKRFGGLGAIYRHLGNNVKIGAGYSWSKFSDDLTDQSYSSHGPFINVIGKF